MQEIRDASGAVIRRSRNLRGIREYVRGRLIKTLAVDQLPHQEGKLSILFEDGSSYETNFASHAVLCGFVRRWLNVQGAPLLMDGQDMGTVDDNNLALSSQAY